MASSLDAALVVVGAVKLGEDGFSLLVRGVRMLGRERSVNRQLTARTDEMTSQHNLLCHAFTCFSINSCQNQIKNFVHVRCGARNRGHGYTSCCLATVHNKNTPQLAAKPNLLHLGVLRIWQPVTSDKFSVDTTEVRE